MLTGEHVADWITHGVRLPQYTAAFRENSIDGQDFPALLSDNQTALRDDLRVQSPLHRKKIHAAIFRQVFGIGSVPAVPQQLECKATPCGSIQLQWDPPANAGVPPVHKFLVQRSPMHSHALWVLVGDPTEDAWMDAGVATGVGYRYRIQSWGGHGPSDWVGVDGCGTDVDFDEKCTEGWDYGAAKAGWREGAGRKSSNRWGSQGGDGGSEADPQPSMQRYLIAVGVVLFGVAVRNTLFRDVLIRVMERSRDVYAKNLLERHKALKSSTFWAARLLSSCLDALFWVWKATAAFVIWGVAVSRKQKAASIPGAEEGDGIQEGSGRAGDSGGDSVGASSERQVAGSDGALLLAVQEGGGEVERGAELRFCKSDTDIARPSSTIIGSVEEGGEVSLPRGSRRSTSSDNMAASVEGGSGRGQGREGGSGRSSLSEDREAEEDGETEGMDGREAVILKGKGR